MLPFTELFVVFGGIMLIGSICLVGNRIYIACQKRKQQRKKRTLIADPIIKVQV